MIGCVTLFTWVLILPGSSVGGVNGLGPIGNQRLTMNLLYVLETSLASVPNRIPHPRSAPHPSHYHSYCLVERLVVEYHAPQPLPSGSRVSRQFVNPPSSSVITHRCNQSIEAEERPRRGADCQPCDVWNSRRVNDHADTTFRTPGRDASGVSHHNAVGNFWQSMARRLPLSCSRSRIDWVLRPSSHR